jgi:hypothetical protein
VATEDIDIFDQDHMTVDAYDPEGNLTERKIIFSASQEGDPLVSDARERSDQNIRMMESGFSEPRPIGMTRGIKGMPLAKAKARHYKTLIRALTGEPIPNDLPATELINFIPALERQFIKGAITKDTFDKLVNDVLSFQYPQSNQGGSDRRLLSQGGSVDSQDIFGYSLGGSVSEMMGRTGSSLTPAQAANLAGAFADPYGGADLTGNYPEFPSGDMSVEEMLSGPRGLSLVENILQGNYGSSALQIVGAIPGVGGIIKVLKAAGKIPPTQIQALKNMGLDVDTTMYHGTVDAGPEGKGIDEFVPGGPSGYQTLTDTGRLRHPTAGIGTWFSDSPEMASRFATSREGVGSPNVLPVYTRRENPLVFTFDKSIDEAFQKAKDAA